VMPAAALVVAAQAEASGITVVGASGGAGLEQPPSRAERAQRRTMSYLLGGFLDASAGSFGAALSALAGATPTRNAEFLIGLLLLALWAGDAPATGGDGLVLTHATGL